MDEEVFSVQEREFPRLAQEQAEARGFRENCGVADPLRSLEVFVLLDSKNSPVRILVNNDLKSALYPWLCFEQLPRLILPLHFGYQSAVV